MRTPLSHSFCQHVVGTKRPLIVSDAREHHFLRDNLAIPDLKVIGYLGIPIVYSDGQLLGSFCVIDHEPREWKAVEIEIMTELANLISIEIDLRGEVQFHGGKPELLQKHQTMIMKIIDEVDTSLPKENTLQQIRDTLEMYTAQ